MAQDSKYILILSSFPKPDLAETAAQACVEKGFAACAQVLSSAHTSFYRWENKLEKAEEYQLLLKTELRKWADCENEIRAYHPFQVPEIISIPIVQASKDYLTWISNELLSKD